MTITVAHLDPITARYEVYERGHCLGEKYSGTYRKPSWSRQGRSIPWNKRDYKVAPPWLKYEVLSIESGSPVRFNVRKEGD